MAKVSAAGRVDRTGRGEATIIAEYMGLMATAEVRFLDPGPAFGRSVDRGRAAKLGAMEIFQYSPTGLRALENADHQNTIMFRPPKSHTVSSRLLIILVIVTFFAFQVVRFSFAAHDQRAFLSKGRPDTRARNGDHRQDSTPSKSHSIND